ncbi:hypothetical protein BCV71DRAFT_94314 [Rhizopus microsporus]|uniref:Uncharacterized protein n=1 Tax=Rhizopus microsporus TaxID=58291 RepID=A0A1X0S6J7_RHIZD|nr:hypothetical protein BCV71DRAFT_94314 [Rhizopus microsporus]
MTQKRTFLKIIPTIFPNRPVGQLNEKHKERLIIFFDVKASATIQDAVNDLIKGFTGLDITNSWILTYSIFLSLLPLYFSIYNCHHGSNQK